jgi:hypothetical protein
MDQAPGNSTISRLLMQQGATSTESMQLEEALGAGVGHTHYASRLSERLTEHDWRPSVCGRAMIIASGGVGDAALCQPPDLQRARFQDRRGANTCCR